MTLAFLLKLNRFCVHLSPGTMRFWKPAVYFLILVSYHMAIWLRYLHYIACNIISDLYKHNQSTRSFRSHSYDISISLLLKKYCGWCGWSAVDWRERGQPERRPAAESESGTCAVQRETRPSARRPPQRRRRSRGFAPISRRHPPRGQGQDCHLCHAPTAGKRLMNACDVPQGNINTAQTGTGDIALVHQASLRLYKSVN